MILVTGSTGNVGSVLVKHLSLTSEPLRVVTRDPAKVAHLDARIERVIGDLLDDETIERAVKGVDRIFLFPMVVDKEYQYAKKLLECAKAAGVKHIVMLSTLAVDMESENEIGRVHREIEKLVENSGIAWTFLRPGSFMSNCLQWRPTIHSMDKVFNPTGTGKTAPISPSDIATVAAVVLTTPGHESMSYELTGPEALNVPEQVEILSQVIGKPIACVDITPLEAAEKLRRHGTPELIVKGLNQMWDRLKESQNPTQTEEVRRLTGKSAETFSEWCSSHGSVFVG